MSLCSLTGHFFVLIKLKQKEKTEKYEQSITLSKKKFQNGTS
jgi:hypothetical protein